MGRWRLRWWRWLRRRRRWWWLLRVHAHNFLRIKYIIHFVLWRKEKAQGNDPMMILYFWLHIQPFIIMSKKQIPQVCNSFGGQKGKIPEQLNINIMDSQHKK